jgi:UDP-glucose 4-epimerase
MSCRFVNADVTNPDIVDLFEGVDYVFHEACSKNVFCKGNPRNDLLVNAYGTLNVIQCAVKAGVKKIIHGSTGSVNGYNPKSFYGVSKTCAELYYSAMKEYYPQLRYTILRYYHVYGPRQSTVGVIPKFITKVLSGEPIEVYGGTQIRHFTWVKDVVKANILAMNSADGETLDVVNSECMTITSLARFIKGVMGKPEHPVEKLPMQRGEITAFRIDNTRAFEMGVCFRPLDEGIAETVGWYEGTH